MRAATKERNEIIIAKHSRSAFDQGQKGLLSPGGMAQSAGTRSNVSRAYRNRSVCVTTAFSIATTIPRSNEIRTGSFRANGLGKTPLRHDVYTRTISACDSCTYKRTAASIFRRPRQRTPAIVTIGPTATTSVANDNTLRNENGRPHKLIDDHNGESGLTVIPPN